MIVAVGAKALPNSSRCEISLSARNDNYKRCRAKPGMTGLVCHTGFDPVSKKLKSDSSAPLQVDFLRDWLQGIHCLFLADNMSEFGQFALVNFASYCM
jgi:hypothetical protein